MFTDSTSGDGEEAKARADADNELYESITDALQDRAQRDKRQARWYRLRHFGLGRPNPPFPGAAAMHFPLIDTEIEKVKPTYYAAMRGGDSLFRFTGLNTSSKDAQDDAAYLLDDRLNYHSNFNRSTLTWIDWCLQSGNSLIKVIWDPQKKQNDFSAIEPEFFIVPPETEDLQDADWFVHILQVSPDAFMRDERYKKECRTEDFVRKIKGGGNPSALSREQAKSRREGLTYSEDPELIVLWEVWQRTDTGAWLFSTKSPVLWGGQVSESSQDDPTVRDEMLSPYKHLKLPVVNLPFEQKDKGIYSPRGIPELLQTLEVAACKNWNDQLDCQTYQTRPVFFSDKGMPGTSNITLKPGFVFDYPVTKVDMGQIPTAFAEQIGFIRETAEWRIQSPDFGIDAETGGHRTAFEISQISQQSQMGSSVRVTLFRIALTELGFMAWENLRQFDRNCLDYIRDNELKQADPGVWDGEYRIEPGGAIDGSGKVQQQQQAQVNLEVAEKAPPGMIDVEAVLSDFFNLQGPSTSARYVIPSQQRAQSEAQRQAEELADMKVIGFPVQVKPTDDHITHLNTMAQYGQACASGSKEPPSAEFAMLQMQHGGMHAEALKGNKSQPAQQALQGSAMLVQYLTSIIQQGQQQPANVLPMGQGGGSNPNGQSMPTTGPSGSSQMDPKTAASIGNAIAAMDKAGIPLSLDQINKVYADMGLPPLDGSSPILRDPGSAMKPQGQPVPMGGAA